MVLAWPVPTMNVLVMAFGLYALVQGLSSLFSAIRGWNHGENRWLVMLEAAVGIGMGIITLRTPAITAKLLISFIAVWALATGVLRIVEGIRLRRQIRGEEWLTLGGLASVIFGLLVLLRPWGVTPELLRMLGIFGVVLGLTEVILGFKLRNARNMVDYRAPDTRQRRAA
jgi:uncharacterized membrane protein HdeD (DUF308 family)